MLFRRDVQSRNSRLLETLGGLLAAAAISMAALPAHAQIDGSQCRAIPDPNARLRCYESLTPPTVAPPPSPLAAPLTPVPPQMIGRWRLVHTPNPQGGKAAVSITHPGELAGSDPDFAGLMVRCGDPMLEVLMILIRPMPLRGEPVVSINGNKFKGSVTAPGTAVLLSAEASFAAQGRWPAQATLSIEVADGGSIIKGLVLLEEYDKALGALTAACAMR